MKKIIILLGIFILSMVGHADAAIWTDLISVNPGAEDGNMTGWTTNTGTWGVFGSSSAAHSGDYCFTAQDSGTSPARMYQTIDVSSYASDIDNGLALCDAGFWYRTQFTSRAGGKLYFLNGSGNTIFSKTSGQLSSGSDWAQGNSGQLSIPLNTRGIELELIGGNFSGNPSMIRARFDDVYLKIGINPVPEPMSMSLLGLGLLGAIAGLRKKK
jgi:hypothetical protein